MTVQFFDSWDDAIAAMRADEESAVSRTTPEQWDITYGDHWIRTARLGRHVVVIFGRVHTLAQVQAALVGCDPEEAEYERGASADAYARGYRFGDAYSVMCPDGELGDTHVATVQRITAEAFAQARERAWDYGRCVGDGLPWALALIGVSREDGR